MKKLLVGLLFAVATLSSHAQVAPVRGEVSAGTYENIKSTSQSLHVNVTGSAAPITSVTMTTTNPEVTNVSSTLLAANTARKNVLIQNNHATATIHVNFSAASATLNDLTIAAGQSLYLSGIVPTAAVRAIGSVASNTSVVVVEGQ